MNTTNNEMTCELHIYKRADGREFLSIEGNLPQLRALVRKAYHTDEPFKELIDNAIIDNLITEVDI